VAAAELAAVAFGVAYILLAIREHRACWIAGGIGTAIYGLVFLDAGLPMQAALQLVYVALSVYGWMSWRSAPADATPIRSWSWKLTGPLRFAVDLVGRLLGRS